MDWTLKIGGAAGQGLQVIGGMLTRTFVEYGLYVFTGQDSESRIRGGHNFLQLRVSNKPVNAFASRVDVLVAMDLETIRAHISELDEDGIVVWDPAAVAYTDADDRGFAVPLAKLTTDAGGQAIMMNSTAAGVVLGMVGFPREAITSMLNREFGRKGEAAVAANIIVALSGYDYASNNCKICTKTIGPRKTKGHMVLTGNQAIALSSIVAGLRFISAYPMSPSTSIIEFIAQRSAEYGIVVEQAEDEIAAINMAIGASYAGVRAMTATSGGGLCLMVEGIGLAGMTETPIVIVDAQRPGPSTGLPTRTEQADLLFLVHAAHGEFPRAILTPGDASQAFYLTAKAFNLAEKYQIPVFLMTDQYLADSSWTTDPVDLSKITIERGDLLPDTAPADYRRYAINNTGISPRAIPGAGPALVVVDSDEHTEEGHITESANVRVAMMNKRNRKLDLLRAEIAPPKRYGPKKAKATLLCWGSNLHLVCEAVDILNARAKSSANCYHFAEIWPFPEEAISKLLKGAGVLMTVENNSTAQLAQLIRTETGIQVGSSILKFDGRPFTPMQVADAAQKEVASDGDN